MKCSACGEEISPNARFCSACGAKVPEQTAPEATSPADAPADSKPQSATVQPLSDNPYQPRRMPSIYGLPLRPNAESETAPAPKTSPVFLFDDEKEEEERALAEERERQKREEERLRREEEQKAARLAREEMLRKQDENPFYGEEDDEDDDDLDEDDEGHSSRIGKIFVAVISLITVLILVLAAYAFLFYTSIGSRLRAYYGFSAESADYAALADWQLEKGSKADAAESWYAAFLLNQDDYDFALTVAQNFERCGALSRAEQMYLYLIDKHPAENDPYDYLMALLVREGKLDEYNALIAYRAQHQADYTPPQDASRDVSLAAPTADIPSGQYSGIVKITLSAPDGAEIRFTIDGSDPTPDSTRYTCPIMLFSNTYTLKAIAIRDGLVSPIFEAFYSIG